MSVKGRKSRQDWMILPHIRPFAQNLAKNVPEAGYGIGAGKFKLVVSERRFLVAGCRAQEVTLFEKVSLLHTPSPSHVLSHLNKSGLEGLASKSNDAVCRLSR